MYADYRCNMFLKCFQVSVEFEDAEEKGGVGEVLSKPILGNAVSRKEKKNIVRFGNGGRVLWAAQIGSCKCPCILTAVKETQVRKG